MWTETIDHRRLRPAKRCELWLSTFKTELARYVQTPSWKLQFAPFSVFYAAQNETFHVSSFVSSTAECRILCLSEVERGVKYVFRWQMHVWVFFIVVSLKLNSPRKEKSGSTTHHLERYWTYGQDMERLPSQATGQRRVEAASKSATSNHHPRTAV